ncbi:hypothetical protein TNCV_3127701 [Trichonephila clavipes]|nr:hypothetical protein TNCV_3127701 [Trichonephila clavipes]
MTSTSSLGLLWCLSGSVSCLTLSACSSLLSSACGKRFVKSSYFLSTSYIRALVYMYENVIVIKTPTREESSQASRGLLKGKVDMCRLWKISWMTGIYQRMGAVDGEHCLVRTIGANVFVKGGKRYHISMTMPVKTCPLKSRQPLKNSFEKC